MSHLIFRHRILRSHALKIKISNFDVLEPLQMFTNTCYLDCVLSSWCRCDVVWK